MKRLKYIALSFILVAFAFVSFGCSASMSSSKLLVNYNNMCSQYPEIFLDGEFNITYPEVIEQKISDTTIPNNKFLKLVQVYEPMLNYSMSFFYTSKNVLDDASEKIDKKEAGKLNDKLMDLKNVLDAFIKAKDKLEYHVEIFARNDNEFNNSVLLAENLKIYENAYTVLISKTFAFNNAFIDIYNAQYPVFNLREKHPTFAGVDFISIYNQSISKLLEVSFEIDGSELNFTGKDKQFISHYTNLVLNEINNFNKLTYTELTGSLFLNEDNKAIKDKVQHLVATFQNNMDSLLMLRQNYSNALNTVDYATLINNVNDINSEAELNKFLNESSLSLDAKNSYRVIHSYLSFTFKVTVDSLHDVLNEFYRYHYKEFNDINYYNPVV